jgi:hypothetical protein
MSGVRKKLTGAPLRASEEREIKRGPSSRSFSAKAKLHALEALDALASLAKGAASEAVRVSAANAMLDRAYGKPASGVKAAHGSSTGVYTGPVEVQWLGDGDL